MNARIDRFVTTPLDSDIARALDRLAALPDAVRVVVMPDVHLADDVCVGTVLATRTTVVPAAAGADLGCGVDAVRLAGVRASVLDDARTAARVLAGLGSAIPALRHEAACDVAEHAPSPDALSASRLVHVATRESPWTHGTLGRGNHFVELQEDEDACLWLVVHSGSRTLGPAIAAHHAPAEGRALVVLEGERADAFLADAAWAVAWAASNRRAITCAALVVLADVLDAREDESSRIGRPHDLVRREEHDGEPLIVHRKGAMWLPPGTAGVLPGSMGTATYHVVARDCPAALASCAHGAGRALSRTAARHRISPRELERSMHGIWFDHRLARALVEEAPAAYKNVRRVVRALHEVVRIERVLRPRLVFKAAS